MNAIELLKEDHDKVDQLFQQVEASSEDGEKLELFQQIKQELDVHAHIEEAIFYPFLLENGDEEIQKITKEAIEEHRQAKMFLREIDNLSEDSDKVEPKLKVLMEDIQHHVMEEEGEMFQMCEEQFDETQLEELGAELEAEKKKFMKSSSARA